MKNILYLSDFLSHEVLGGAELNDDELLKLLSKSFSIKRRKCSEVKFDELKDCDFIILSNFISLRETSLEYIKENKNYIVYEHDHKYLASRQPNTYQDYKAPPEELRHVELYKKAKKVFVQSSLHQDIILKNIDLDNVYNVSGNLWSEEHLSLMEVLLLSEKVDDIAIMDSPIKHKNTIGAVLVCESLGKNYTLIKSKNYVEFLSKISSHQKLLFIPKTPETLSRIIVEAKMMGCSIMTNSNIGATYEEWFTLKGDSLINYMRSRKTEIISDISEVINESCN
jgi:hypothetical protein